MNPPVAGVYRSYLLDSSTFVIGGVASRPRLRVYAQAGETIYLGSSATGIGAGSISYIPPAGGAATTCPAGTGLIATPAEEAAGPLPLAAGGYAPCTIAVGAGQTGVWQIIFTSSDPTGTVACPSTLTTVAWSQPAAPPFDPCIRAWDITVRGLAGTAVPGRVYANALPIFVSTDFSQVTAFSGTVVTRDGYRYAVSIPALSPGGATFFSNNRGFRDATTGAPLYRSIQFTGPAPTGSLPPGVAVQDPLGADTTNDYTGKFFLNSPASDLPAGSVAFGGGTTWMMSEPIPPPTPTGFQFVGAEGTVNQAGTSPLTGVFSFTSASAGFNFAITIDLNNNGIFGDGSDRRLSGTTVVGTNSVTWDGLDANGGAVPAQTAGYGVQIQTYAGEAHFPYLDAESNTNIGTGAGGFIITRLNTPPGFSTGDVTLVYYNDNFICAANEGTVAQLCWGTPPSPRNALVGVSSTGGAHRYGCSGGFTTNNCFGDRRGINTWAYFPSAVTTIAGGVRLAQADLSATKSASPTTMAPGTPVTFTADISNAGPSDAPNATVTDVFPATLLNPGLVSCTIVTGTGSCGSATFTGNTFNATVSLNNGATARYVFKATVAPTASAPITNSIVVLRPNDVNDPTDPNRTGAGNNTGSVTITPSGSPPTTADLAITKTDGLTTISPGASLTYTIVATNLGPASVTASIADTIPSVLTNVSWTCTATAGSACGAASGSGNTIATTAFLSGDGGQATYLVTATVSPTAGGGTVITNTVTISPPSGITDPNPSNNTATDVTQVIVPTPTPTPTPAVSPPIGRCIGNIRGAKLTPQGVGLSGWTINLRKNGELIRTEITDAVGAFNFLGLDMGAYTVEEVMQTGWVAQSPPSVNVTLQDCDQNITGVRFVNARPTTPTPVPAPATAVPTPTGAKLPTQFPRTGESVEFPLGAGVAIAAGLVVALLAVFSPRLEAWWRRRKD